MHTKKLNLSLYLQVKDLVPSRNLAIKFRNYKKYQLSYKNIINKFKGKINLIKI